MSEAERMELVEIAHGWKVSSCGPKISDKELAQVREEMRDDLKIQLSNRFVHDDVESQGAPYLEIMVARAGIVGCFDMDVYEITIVLFRKSKFGYPISSPVGRKTTLNLKAEAKL